jgi:hypothetical protein
MMFAVYFYTDKQLQLKEFVSFGDMEEARKYVKDKAKRSGYETYACQMIRYR